MRVFPVPHMVLWLALFFVVSVPICVAQEDGASDLPLRKVVLFTWGVGFFDRRGEVDGDARVELEFDVKDVNDLLKSMVLQDFGGRPGVGGHVRITRSGHPHPGHLGHRSHVISRDGRPWVRSCARSVESVWRWKRLPRCRESRRCGDGIDIGIGIGIGVAIAIAIAIEGRMLDFPYGSSRSMR
jgi:hypothetical protein